MREIFFDLETYLIAPGCLAPKIVCASCKIPGSETVLINRLAFGEFIAKWLCEPNIHFVAQNIAFDMACVCSNFPELIPLVFKAYDEGRVRCTMEREKLLDIAEGKFRGEYVGGKFVTFQYSLEDLCKRHLNIELDKSADSWRLRYGELDGVPFDEWPDEAVDYAVQDTDVLPALYAEQERRAEDIEYALPTEADDIRAAFALYLTSAWGIHTDGTAVRELDEKIETRMVELREILHKSGIMRTKRKMDEKLLAECGDYGHPNLKLSKNLKFVRELITCSYRGGSPPTTDKGAIQTSAEVIAECDDPNLDFLVEFSTLQKQSSTYVKYMREGVKTPVQCRYNAVGAATDRTSSSGPNMQNQPKLPGLRDCFVPRTGHILISCDFDSQEMRTLAQSCLDILGYSHLAKCYQDDPDFDPHLEVASLDLGISMEEARRRKGQKDPEFKAARQKAKVKNFGLPGGMGGRGLKHYAKGYGLDITEDQGYEWRDEWLEQRPEMRDYFAHVSTLVGGRMNFGTIVIPQTGFRRYGAGFTDGSNTYFQSLGATCSKRALWLVCQACYTDRDSPLYGARPVVFIHDEIIVECDERWAHEAAMELERLMCVGMQKFTPDIPARASAALMTCWQKDAEPMHDEGGRLIPWAA